MAPAFQTAASWAYLLRSVHAISGFMLQEILFSEITFATFGTFKWLFSSVFPRGKTKGQCPSLPVPQQRCTSGPEDTGKGEGRTRQLLRPPPTPQHQYSQLPKSHLLGQLCGSHQAVGAHCAPRNLSFAGLRFSPCRRAQLELALSLQAPTLLLIIDPPGSSRHLAMPAHSPQPRQIAPQPVLILKAQ